MAHADLVLEAFDSQRSMGLLSESDRTLDEDRAYLGCLMFPRKHRGLVRFRANQAQVSRGPRCSFAWK